MTEQRRPYQDHGRAVESALFGPKLRRVLLGFEASHRGGCRHDGPKFAMSGDLRSACADCAAASGTFATAANGPCSVCGRMLTAPPERIWSTVSEPSRVVVAVRLCAECAETELQALDGKEPQ